MATETVVNSIFFKKKKKATAQKRFMPETR